MKSKRLLLMLLMALLVPWAAQAQETLTVHAGTETSRFVPFYGYYADDAQTNQMIYPATELADMAGGEISAMMLYWTNGNYSGGSGVGTWTISIGETSATTLSGLDNTTSLTQVFTGGLDALFNSNNTLPITFDNAYTYNGGNLLVQFSHSASSYKDYAFYGETVTGASYCYNSQRNFLPKTTFTYEAAASDCPKPNNFVASNVTAHTADLSWESDGFEFVLQYKKASDSNWTQKWPDANSYTLTGLAAETEYQVRVAAFHETCPTDPETGDHVHSDWREISFTTGIACFAPTNLAVTPESITAREATVTWEGTSNSYVVMIGEENLAARADFEDQTIPAAFTNTGARPWSVTAGGANGSGYCAIPGNQGANSSQSDLTLEVTLNNPATVSFYAKVSSENNYDWGRFFIDGTQMMQISGTTQTNWTAYSYELAAGTHTLIWRYVKDSSSASGNDLFYVDDIVVSAAPASWTDYNANAQTYTFTNLTPNRHYQVKVKGNCGNEGYSQETAPVSFTTLESCFSPTDLAASNVTAHEATITWTSAAEAWQICVNDDEENLIDVTETTYNFTGLTPETTYAVKVRTDCGNEYSDWTNNTNFTTGIACQVPTAVTVGDITTNSAVVSWESEAGNYSLMLGDEVIAENITTNSYTLTSLTPSTYYTVKVKAICGGEDGESQWSSGTSFYTACAAVTTFPWTETFESYASGNFSDPCWVNEHIEGSGAQLFKVYTSTNAGNTTHQLQLPDMAIGTLTKLVLPEMNLPENYEFSIDIYRSSSTYNTSYAEEGIRVYASTNGEIEGATELAFIPRQYTVGNDVIPAEATTGWYTYEIPIGMSGTCYIILRGESQYCTSTYMDNLTVMAMPTCVKPTNLAQTHTNHSATLSWTAGNEGQNAWQIAYSTTSFDPNAADFDLTTVEVIDNVEETSYTFDKTLNANTHYYMYVRGYCGDEDYSKWVGIDFTTGTANPSPTITSVDEITPVSAVLRWTAAGGDYLESYDIYYSQTSGQPANDSLIQYTGVDAGFTSKILENLTEGYWYVYMRAYHGETDGYSSWTPYYGYGFQVPEACPKPTNLTAGNPTPNSITLTWTEGATWQYAWDVAYSTDSLFDPADTTATYSIVEVFGQQGPTITCTVTGLDSNTTYYFSVMGHCNSPYGDCDEWTNVVSETTLDGCPVPFDINVTTASNTATINWTGFSDSYTVQYRTAGGYETEIFQGFENGLGDWIANISSSSSGIKSASAHEGSFGFTFVYSEQNASLISPVLDGSNGVNVSFYYREYTSSYGDEQFYVGYTTNENETDPTAFEYGDIITASLNWQEYTETFPEGTKRIAIQYVYNDAMYLYIDDITIQCGEYNEPSQWVEANTNTESVTLLNLIYGRKYEAQVKAECSDYSDMFTFTTKALKRFTTAGDWSVADNWTPAGAPTMDNDVTVEAAATITGVAYADNITVDSTGTITIEDGGQLVHNNAGVTATVKKTINGYTVDNYETNNGYYFIANPLTTLVYPEEAGLITDDNNDYYTYDLYDWAPGYSLEWRNYRDGEFSTLSYNNTPAYLYANMNTVELAFNGTVRSSQNSVSTSVYVSGAEFGAWNLIGNPFVCNAYLVDNNGNALPYYKMNADGNGYEATTGEAIAPVTGIFYEAPANGSVYFTREAPANGGKGVLNMNLRSNNKQLDNAIVSFGEGQQMSKFSFRENSTKVYIPMDGIDYAVVNAGQAGEMPVSFKAENNGTYTLSFSSKEVSFSYLHLIDNMTGNDVNLLNTPSYTFDARTTDYANRFRLVFATGSSAENDNFGFVNAAGNLCIFGIEGEATLQVVDVLGHVVSSNQFSGSYEQKLNVAPGVYMLRLINGNDVKVQKMVIR